MIIKNPQFEISAVNPKQYPQNNLPQIVLVGKSNVGKSSFINRIAKKTSAGVFDPSGQGLFIYIGIKYNILLYLIYLFYHFHFCR